MHELWLQPYFEYGRAASRTVCSHTVPAAVCASVQAEAAVSALAQSDVDAESDAAESTKQARASLSF